MSIIDKIIIEATKIKDAGIVLATLVPTFEPIILMVITAMNHFWPQTKAEWTPDKVAAQIAEQRATRQEDDEERNKRRTDDGESGDDGQS